MVTGLKPGDTVRSGGVLGRVIRVERPLPKRGEHTHVDIYVDWSQK